MDFLGKYDELSHSIVFGKKYWGILQTKLDQRVLP